MIFPNYNVRKKAVFEADRQTLHITVCLWVEIKIQINSVKYMLTVFFKRVAYKKQFLCKKKVYYVG